MKLLLDTRILLWWLGGSPLLPKAARDAIYEQELIYVSAATAWEIAIKSSQGKLQFEGDLDAQLEVNYFRPLAVTIAHAAAAASLPWLHRDPFDRMLIAQAKVEEMTVVTSDPQFAAYGVPVILG